jgi:hypothetical protein
MNMFDALGASAPKPHAKRFAAAAELLAGAVAAYLGSRALRYFRLTSLLTYCSVDGFDHPVLYRSSSLPLALSFRPG